MKKEEKTNVMRVLDGKGISYESHSYNPDATMSGEEIAVILKEDPEKVFKTLVTQGKSGAYYVFVIPVVTELNLKKAGKVGFQIELAPEDLISVAECTVADIV